MLLPTTNSLAAQLGSQKGQALLIVVLSLAVVLTLVLSILARSVTDIKISTSSEESLRAFSAAEAGIETSLLNSLTSGQRNGTLQGASFTATVSQVGKGAKEFTNPTPLFSGETSFFWFVGHDISGKLACNADSNCFTGSEIKICWGKEGTSASTDETPALEASVVYDTTPNDGDYADLAIARDTFDPNPTRTSSNNFSLADGGGCTIAGEKFAFQKTLNFQKTRDLGVRGLNIPESSYGTPNGLQFLVTRMIYNQNQRHTVAVSVDFAGDGLLPAQGTTVDSLGTSNEANRKVSVFQGFGEPPLPFGAVVFSPTGIAK